MSYCEESGLLMSVTAVAPVYDKFCRGTWSTGALSASRSICVCTTALLGFSIVSLSGLCRPVLLPSSTDWYGGHDRGLLGILLSLVLDTSGQFWQGTPQIFRQ